MIEYILLKLYNNLPYSLRRGIGKSNLLKPFRNILLQNKGSFRESKVLVSREYLTYKVDFVFYASIRVAAQAKKRGIENTILRNSIHLLKQYKKIENNATVLDIGANFGYLSLVWANSISSDAKVIAFEPNPDVCKSLHKSIVSNNLQSVILLENMAVGSKNGKIDLFMNSTTSNTLAKNSKIQNSILIDIISIDSFTKEKNIDICHLIKIDVDGIELDILEGCREFMNRCKPIFIVETNKNEQIIDFFNQHSYDILDMNLEIFRSGNVLPLNIFCIPKE